MTAKPIDPAADNVFGLDLSVDVARALAGTTGDEDLDAVIDEAQGFVFSERGAVSYVLIKITR